MGGVNLTDLYVSLVRAAKVVGIELDVSSNKRLQESLDKAVIKVKSNSSFSHAYPIFLNRTTHTLTL